MFIAKNEDLIILAKNTREELEEALFCMNYTSIEETDIEYELYNGEYLTKEEITVKRRKAQVDELKEQLNQLDLKSIRAIRANDVKYMEKYEAEAEVLRQQVRELENE